MEADRSSQVDALVNAVRQQWESSACPDLRAQIDSSSIALEAQELLEVVLVDQACRWQSGQPKPVEEYLREFPELENNTEFQLDLVYGEFRARKKEGALDSVDAFAERFPYLADRLHQQVGMGKLFETVSEETIPPRSVAGDTTHTEASPSAPDVERAPLSADDFQLIRQLGSGAMGVVHLAVQKSLNKRVALKSLSHFPSNREDLIERFIREARAVASLRHANIVGVHGIGRFPDGGYFLVMDLVEGESLKERIEREPLSREEAIRVVGQVARAIDHAHRKGVIHRDLKPANIMLDQDGNAMVTDFGLAKAFFVSGPDMSQDGQLIGTPSFMSPEQARGDVSRIDSRSDVYALGGILYACLTGRPPFQGKSTVQVLSKVLSDDPPPLDQVCSDVPIELVAICGKCLQKDPAERFATAAAVADALKIVPHEDPGGVSTVSTRVPTESRFSWRSLLFPVSLAVVAAVLYIIFSPKTRPAPTVDVDWNILVYRGDKANEPIKLVEQPGPVFDGDWINLELTFSDPSYAYFFWVDSQAKVHTLHPTSSENSRVGSLRLPDLEGGIPVVGPPGTEVFVLILRDKPVRDVAELARRIQPPASFGELAMRAPLLNGTVLDGRQTPGLAEVATRIRGPAEPEKLPPSKDGAHSLQRWRSALPTELGQAHFFAFSHLPRTSTSPQPASAAMSATVPATMPATVTPAIPTRDRFALLVGVQEYQHLGESQQLRGSRNDVAAMKAVLMERFGFPSQNIVTLVDQAATSGAIRSALRELADRVQGMPPTEAPAQVVFHFSGHGSQIPDDDDERSGDGLDETLVPYDAVGQGGPQDIRDDELYDFAKQVCTAGQARLWIVLDCCHSGSGARGITRIRKLSRPGLVAQRPSSRGTLAEQTRQLPKGAVALYACRDVEVEPEFEEQGKSYGLLTRFLVQVLREQPNVSQLSYAGLRDAVVMRYRQNPAVGQPPTPQVEGDKRAVVCGAGIEADRPACWPVVQDGSRRDEVVLRAGALHGVTVGSHYEIYESSSDASQEEANSVAWFRVTSVNGTTARGSVFAWQDDQSIVAQLPADFKQGFTVERYHDPGDFVMRVRVARAADKDHDDIALSRDSPDVPDAIRQVFASSDAVAPRELSWLQWVPPDESCDFVLRIDGHFAALFPATGVAEVAAPPSAVTRSDLPQSLRGGWGDGDRPFNLRAAQRTTQRLRSTFRNIARARNLIRIASNQTTQKSKRKPLQVKVELIRGEEPQPDEDLDQYVATMSEWKAWPIERLKPHQGTRVMRNDEIYALRVTNLDASRSPVFVTVLQVDGNMGIKPLHPDRPSEKPAVQLAEESRLEPGSALETEPWRCNQLDAEDPPIYGPRYAIVLATREPNDFYRLGQTSLMAVRGTPGRPSSSLDELLMRGTDFITRDARVRPRKLYDDSWAVDVVQWVAIPAGDK